MRLPSIAALCWSVAGCSGSAGTGVQASGPKPAASDSSLAPQAPAATSGPAPTLAVRDVSVGENHVCALAANGEVWCWGANYSKQVIASSVDAYATPVRIPLPLAATNVAVSDAESCALLSDGQRACWGGPNHPDIEIEIDSSQRYQRLVPALPANCGVTPGDELVCRGYNRYGVLGLPWDEQAKFEQELPQRVVPLPGRVEQVALAGDLGCAVVGPERKLLCWGNGWGCNGPKPVDLPAKVSALSSGGVRVCLLTADGDVYQFTELPEPESPSPPTCRDVEARQPVAKVAENATLVSCFAPQFSDCSMCSGCIVDRQQQVLCWHELGPTGTVSHVDDAMHVKHNTDRERARSLVPALVEGVSHPKRLAVGDGFYCAVMESGRLLCWGSNGYGQLGRGHVSDAELTPSEPAWPLQPGK